MGGQAGREVADNVPVSSVPLESKLRGRQKERRSHALHTDATVAWKENPLEHALACKNQLSTACESAVQLLRNPQYGCYLTERLLCRSTRCIAQSTVTPVHDCGRRSTKRVR